MMDFENAEQLRKFLLDRFGIELSGELRLKSTPKGIRVINSVLSKESENIFGIEGIMAYSKNSGLSPYLFQLVGPMARRNIIALNKKDTIAYAEAQQIKKNVTSEPGIVILAYKGHILGFGILEGKGKIRCPLKEKQKRNIMNDLNPYPGRVL